MIEVKTSLGSVTDITVFSNFVAKEESSSMIQFEIAIADSITSVITLVDGERTNFDD